MDNDKTQARPPEYGGATGSAFLSDRMVEDYIRTLAWTPLATEDDKALVAGNIRTFAGYIREHVGTCKCGKPMSLDAVLDVPPEYVCTMESSCMPECCAQWRFDGKCANTGGDCPFRKTSNAHADGSAVADTVWRDVGGVR
jgi:hypothetical protein